MHSNTFCVVFFAILLLNDICNNVNFFLQVATRLENPTRLYMLESQKRQVRQFLSSEELDNNEATDCRGNNNDNTISMNPQNHHHYQRLSDNLLAPPTLNYSALTNSAPAENYESLSKQNIAQYAGTIDCGKLIFSGQKIRKTI